ncbi:MAG: hypothetical protein KBH75_02255 [Saprospiraceae bacterium]|nr:hypothetical protein [Saprospiraceae bacterium]
MNKFYFTLLLSTMACWALAQNVAFKYQGIARNNQNAPLSNQAISLRLTILNANNSPVYAEQHMVTTSPIGLFNVEVCRGSQPSGSCDVIDWSKGGYQLKVDMDVAGGTTYAPMGVSPILMTPVAAYALKAASAANDADTDPQNELQNLSFTQATQQLSLTNGNSVDLSSLGDDDDADPANEIQTLTYDSTNNEIALSKGGGSVILPTGGSSLWKMNGTNILQYVNETQSITFDKSGSAPLNQAYFELNFRPNAKHSIISGPTDWASEFWTKPANALGKIIAYGSSVKEYPRTYAQHYLRFDADTFTIIRNSNTLNANSKNSVTNELVLLNQAYNGNTGLRLVGVALTAFEGVGQIYNAVGGRPGGVITAANVNNTVVPYVGVFNPNNPNQLIGGIFIQGTQSVVNANVKNFSMDHPRDPSKEIWYASVEGPEAAAYDRGTAQLVNGEAFVPFSEHFELVINPQTMTVSLTPGAAESEGLAVVEKTALGFRVRELRNGKGNYSFDWEAKGVRKGYEDYKVLRIKGVETPVPVNVPSTVREVQEAFQPSDLPIRPKGDK